jgi:hypothetical protein
VASLQMKIVTEDKAVEARTNDFLNDWERAKPVAGDLRPGGQPVFSIFILVLISYIYSKNIICVPI